MMENQFLSTGYNLIIEVHNTFPVFITWSALGTAFIMEIVEVAVKNPGCWNFVVVSLTLQCSRLDIYPKSL